VGWLFFSLSQLSRLANSFAIHQGWTIGAGIGISDILSFRHLNVRQTAPLQAVLFVE
jgi:hypothetical protein